MESGISDISKEKHVSLVTKEKEEKIEEFKIKERLELESKLKNGANWFYWIAGLSLVNSIVMLSGSDWYFLVGLGITQIVDLIIGSGTALVFDIIVAGILVLFGSMAKNKNYWSFVIGMIFYGLDGILLILAFNDYLSFGFHVLALFGIYGGLKASMELGKYEQVIA